MRDTRRALVSLKYKVRGVDRELARGCAPGPPARLQRSSPRLQVQPESRQYLRGASENKV